MNEKRIEKPDRIFEKIERKNLSNNDREKGPIKSSMKKTLSNNHYHD